MSSPVPDGLVAVVKRDCPTCQLVVPVLAALHFDLAFDQADDVALGVRLAPQVGAAYARGHGRDRDG